MVDNLSNGESFYVVKTSKRFPLVFVIFFLVLISGLIAGYFFIKQSNLKKEPFLPESVRFNCPAVRIDDFKNNKNFSIFGSKDYLLTFSGLVVQENEGTLYAEVGGVKICLEVDDHSKIYQDGKTSPLVSLLNKQVKFSAVLINDRLFLVTADPQ